MLKRIEKVKALVDNLLDATSFVEALVADGWTEEMASKGFALHEKTWRNVDSVADQIQAIEGKALVEKVCHIWPALPGAGVSPVLFGALCGVKTQHIKASRRGQHFANHFVSAAEDSGVSFAADLFSSDYERLIVSGSDETIAHFNANHDGVIGFGHRESIAVVDETFTDFKALADDIVQWNQQGCFSVRTVFYMGGENKTFCQKLANTLYEREWETSHGSDALSNRIQKRAIQEMTSDIFVAPSGIDENCAFVASGSGTWLGGVPAPGCVWVFNAKDSDTLFSTIGLASHQRQGVAFHVSDSSVKIALIESGFTHISKVGQMQAPPLAWHHDGRSNVNMFLK